MDRVVAWGAFPASNGRFQVVQGRFRVPLIKGEMDLDVEKWDSYFGSFRKDLDVWLGNLYFEIVHLPRYAPGQKEYEAELLFSFSSPSDALEMDCDGEMLESADLYVPVDEECADVEDAGRISTAPASEVKSPYLNPYRPKYDSKTKQMIRRRFFGRKQNKGLFLYEYL